MLIARKAQQIGIGAQKTRDIILSNMVTRDVVTLLKRLSMDQKWPLEKEFKDTDGYHLIFQIGQWGWKISGSQQLFITLLQKENDTVLSMISKSTMGQLVDWGANKKNLNIVESYLHNPISKTHNKVAEIQTLSAMPQIASSFWTASTITYLIALIVVVVMIFIIQSRN